MQEMADRIIDHYERHARDWDTDRNLYVNPWNDKPWHERFVTALPVGASVLDLGCGSGAPVARYLVECGLRVTGGRGFEPENIWYSGLRLLLTIYSRLTVPGRKRLRKGVLASCPFFDGDDGPLAVPIGHWNVEPGALHQELEVALHIGIDR